MASKRTRARRVRATATIGALLASIPTVHGAESVALKFDWGPDLTILRDVETVKVSPAPAPGQLSSAASTVRRDVPGMRYRLAAKRQADGVYEIRVIDFLMRSGMGDLLITGESPARQMIDTTTPPIKLDPRGAFVALLEPDAAAAVFKTMDKSFEDRLRSLPPEQHAEARAQLEEIRSVGYLSARAAFPWFESVGFWSGRRLEFGRAYSESVEERFVPLASARGPVRVQRRWRAVAWTSCEEAPEAATPVSAGTTTNGPVSAAPRGDCVRLSLVSTFRPAGPSFTAQADGKFEPRLESEIDLVTEPGTLRPRRSLVTWRSRWRDASGAEGVRDVQAQRMRWTYGPPALVALKGTLPPPPGLVAPPPVEPADLKPKPEWGPGSPERAYVDFRAAVDRGDWSTATTLMHPEFLARVARRIRGKDGAQMSEELRKALFGDDVTSEQIDASSDLALLLLVAKRLADDQRNAVSGWDRPPMIFPAKVVLGHVEDREGRIHVVTQQDGEYRMPLEYRGSSSTVVLSLADYAAPGSAIDAGAPLASCDPARDAYRCWRIWRDASTEYEPISRVQSQLAMRPRTASGAGAPAVPGASAPSSPQPPASVAASADPETMALRAALQKASSQLYSATATRPDLQAFRALVGAPAFTRLSPAEQHQARVALSQGLMMNGDLADGLPLAREAAQAPLGLPAIYQMWAGAAVQMRQRAEAARAIHAWLTRFPTSAGLLDPRLVAEIDSEPPRTDEEKREFRQLYEALFAAGENVRNAEGLDSRWTRLALLRLEDAALPDAASAAAEVVRRIDDIKFLMMMRADRRYDLLTAAHPELFDLARAQASILEIAERKVAAEPRVLSRRLVLLGVMVRAGQAQRAVVQATSLIDGLIVANAPEVTLRDVPPPVPFDDAKEQLRWLFDLRSRALVLLGRYEEALQDNRRAMQAARYSRDPVSQALNAAHRAVELGRAQEAMDLLASAPRGAPYGRMVHESARLRAAYQLDDRAVVGRALAYLRDNRDDAPTSYLMALLYLPGERGAAEVEFQRLLEHPEHRMLLLYHLQRTAAPIHPLPQRDRVLAQLNALAETPKLREMVDRVGRILDYPEVPFAAE